MTTTHSMGLPNLPARHGRFDPISGSHRFALFIAVAIALGITVHQVFLIVAQIVAIAACAYLMIGFLHQRRWVATQGQLHP